MKLPAFQTIKLEEPEAGRLVVTLNRPAARNALDTQMGRELRAKQLILTGVPFTAQQACDWGMVNEVHAPGELMGATMAVARRIAANAPISVRQAKRSIHAGLQMDLASGLAFEVQAYERMISTEDRREGINAFNEKRRPAFTGR